MSESKSESKPKIESRKPDISIKGNNNSILSIWISRKGLKLSVSRRVGNTFEKVDTYNIPLEFILAKAMFKEEMHDSLKDFCINLERIVFGEEVEEEEVKE